MMRFRELPEQVSSIIEVKGNLTIVTLLHHSLYDHRQNPTTHLSSCAYQNAIPAWYCRFGINSSAVYPLQRPSAPHARWGSAHPRLHPAFLQHTANGRSLKAQCHHIMSINCQVLECEAALFLQDLIDHLRYFLKDCDPVSADGRLTKRICLCSSISCRVASSPCLLKSRLIGFLSAVMGMS